MHWNIKQRDMKFLLTYIWGLELYLEIINFSAGRLFRNFPTETSHLTFEINWSLLKHSPGMGSCENSEFLRPLQENKTRVLWPQFFQNKELFLKCVFVLLPGVAGVRSLRVTQYCSLLMFIIYLNYLLDPSVQKHGFTLLRAACRCDCIQLNSRELYSGDPSY